MDSEVELYMIRAEDEFLLAQKDMEISTNNRIKEILGISKEKTFFYSVITHSYYAIFYAAKAYLLTKHIKTRAPEEHKKTFEEFSKIVKKGILDEELLRLYEDAIVKANALLNIFRVEKKKRGHFTYNIRSEANIPYAKESLENSRKFTSAIKSLIP